MNFQSTIKGYILQSSLIVPFLFDFRIFVADNKPLNYITMNDTYQVTILCKAKSKVTVKKVLKILAQYGEAWKPNLLFYDITIPDKNSSSKFKLGEIAFLLKKNSHLVHTFVLALELVRENLQSSTTNCVLDLYEMGNLGE